MLLSLNETQKHKFENIRSDLKITYANPKTINASEIEKYDIIIGNPPINTLKQPKKLKLLQLSSAGSDNYSKEGILDPHTILTNATGAYGLAISEYMLAGVLMLYKKLHLYSFNKQLHLWQNMGKVKSIEGSRVLIIGMGDIGSEFGKRMKSLNAHTVGIRRTLSDKPDYIDEISTMDKLDELLPTVDIIALSLPQTKETIHLMTKERLLLTKKDAVIINVGRGSVLDLHELNDVLNQGHLLGAVLDVTDPEPLPLNHEVWNQPNVIITPHVSGGWSLDTTFEKMLEISYQNLCHYLNHEELKNVVDFSTGYRKV